MINPSRFPCCSAGSSLLPWHGCHLRCLCVQCAGYASTKESFSLGLYRVIQLQFQVQYYVTGVILQFKLCQWLIIGVADPLSELMSLTCVTLSGRQLLAQLGCPMGLSNKPVVPGVVGCMHCLCALQGHCIDVGCHCLYVSVLQLSADWDRLVPFGTLLAQDCQPHSSLASRIVVPGVG